MEISLEKLICFILNKGDREEVPQLGSAILSLMAECSADKIYD